MMKFIGEIDIHDLRNLPSRYKFKDLNDEAEFYVIRTFYPGTEDRMTWTFESKWFATEEDAERYFRKDWSFDKGTKPKADIVKVKLTISKQIKLIQEKQNDNQNARKIQNVSDEGTA